MTSDAIIASIDLFPTIMHYAGSHSFNQEIDGINVSSFFENPSLRPRDEYVYVKGGDVPELFNLKQDVGESDNLLQKYPDKVKELQLLMQKY